jgi:hypothetical protein
MAQLISSTVNNLPTDYDTKIPSLNQSANIEEAFRLYHYGKSQNELIADSNPATKSVYQHLKDHGNRLTQLEDNPPVINSLLMMGA